MPDYQTRALREALGRIGGRPFLAATVRYIEANVEAIAAELGSAVLAAVPQFSATMNPQIQPESARHSREHVQELLRLLHGGPIGDFEFVRAHARRRAEQRLPIEATLHAYRVGHKVLSRWLLDPTPRRGKQARGTDADVHAIVAFTMEYTDAISATFASAYSARALLLADLAGDERAELLELLLAGRDEADPHVARLLHEAGFPSRRQSFCVGLARSVDASEMTNTARARRLAESIEAALGDSALFRLVDVRDNSVTIICSDLRPASGWTARRRPLPMRVSEALQDVGNAALIGLSNDVPSISHIPDAWREAKSVLEFADVSRRVVRFAEVPLQQLLLHFAGQEFRQMLPAWAQSLHAEDARARGILTDTARAYADADMNVLRAAQVLGVHPNTVYARFQRIQDLTGLQPRQFRGLSQLLLIADCTAD